MVGVVTALICDEINRAAPDGRVSLFGLRDTFRVPRTPSSVSFCVYLEFVAPHGLEEFTLGIGCLPRVPIDRWDIKQTSVVIPPDQTGDIENRFTFDLRLRFAIDHAGWHDLHLLQGDREVLAKVPFRVLVAEG